MSTPKRKREKLVKGKPAVKHRWHPTHLVHPYDDTHAYQHCANCGTDVMHDGSLEPCKKAEPAPLEHGLDEPVADAKPAPFTPEPVEAPAVVDKGAFLKPPARRRLPAERASHTHKFSIWPAGATEKIDGYLIVGFFPDGTVGEIFCKLDQQGGTVSGFMDAWAISVSTLLQLNVPLADICAKFRGMRFVPAGRTDSPGIRVATSPVDYVVRYLHRRYVEQKPLADD